MKASEEALIPTRASLIGRLKSWQDESSWQEFFNTYWKLIYGIARKAGLADVEAQDVVQETLIAVAKHMPTFKYDPAIGSFKAWLLNMTRWRILGQFRKRRPLGEDPVIAGDTTSGTGVIDRVIDPKTQDLDAAWEAEWQRTLFEAAVATVKRKVAPEKYQIFDFYVNKEWPPEKVAERFNVSLDQVYQVKHRITDALREEVERLEKDMT